MTISYFLKRPSKNSFGINSRWGGGWDYKFGFDIGSKQINFYLLIFLITFYWGDSK